MNDSLKITPYTISTMTVTGNLGATPNLKQLYESVHFIPYWWVGEGVIKIEMGEQKKGICTEDILHNTNKAKKSFLNQSSLVFRLQLNTDNTSPKFKEVNIKIFKNGGFQMTGISAEETGRKALQRFIDQNKDKQIWNITPHIQSFQFQLINTDFRINKAIRRDRMYRLLVENYGLCCSYEPSTYQAVKTAFYWNAHRSPESPAGICGCPDPCEGSGDGCTIGNCRKITIAPFRTGSVIITGAKQVKQIDDAYAFITSILREHADYLLREEVEVPTKKKQMSAPPTTTEGILRQKMRASPRNVYKLTTAR